MNKKLDIHKNNWASTIFTHGKWYMLSSLLSKGINIFVLRIYTEYLTPSDYGILDTLNTIALLLPFFISLYLDSAFGRFFHEYKQDKEKLRALFSTIFIFVSVFGSIVVILTLASSRFWVTDLLSIPVYPYIFLAFIPPLFNQLGNLGLIFLRQSLLSKHTTVVEISSVLINLAVALPLLIWVDYGILAKLWGNFATALSLFLFYTVFFLRNGLLRLTFNTSMLKESLAFSVPLFPVFAGAWIAGVSDRLVIANYSSLEAVGLYSIGFTVGKLMYIFQDAITQVTGPITMSGLIADKEVTKIKIAQTSFYLWGIMLFINFGMFLFSKELIAIFADSSYREAQMIIPIIAFSYVLGSQQRIFSTVIAFHKKNWVISSGGIIQAVTNLGLNIIFVPQYGYIAAAYSTAITLLVYTLWIYFFANKFESLNLSLFRYIYVLFIVLGFILLINIFEFNQNIFFRILYSVLLLIVLFITNYKKEYVNFKQIFK
jgi:O-antigen/teichoic acid export membrane protein